MNIKKYRACLLLFLIAVIAISVIFYVNHSSETEIPADGMLVKNETLYEGGEHA